MRRLSAIENIVGIKEASGNISQMAAILNPLPERFHRAQRRRRDHAARHLAWRTRRHFRRLERNSRANGAAHASRVSTATFETARRIHRRVHPLMEVNFVESNPIPVKAAMAQMGLLEPVWRLPLVAPKAENEARIHAVLESLDLLEFDGAIARDGPRRRMREFMLPAAN